MSIEYPNPFADDRLAASAPVREDAAGRPDPNIDPASDAGSVAQDAAGLYTAVAMKTYRVAGPHPVHGTPPGETFTAQLDPGQEAFLVEVGHIEIVGRTPDENTESADGADKEQ